MAINWGANSALAGFQNALALGADIGGAIKQNREDSALAAFMTASSKPDTPVPSGPTGALGAPAMPTQWGGNGGGIVPTETQKTESQAAYERLAKINPRLALQAQDRVAGQESARAKLMQEHRAAALQAIPVVTNMLKQAKERPEAWGAILSKAQQLGIPGIEAAPAQYDPAWVDGQIQMFEAFSTPEGREALSTAGKQATDEGLKPGSPEFSARVKEIWNVGERKLISTQPGGGVAGYDPVTGRTEMVIAPNTGGYAAGAPVTGGSSTKTIGGKTYEKRGDQWFEVGGGSSNATGGF